MDGCDDFDHEYNLEPLIHSTRFDSSDSLDDSYESRMTHHFGCADTVLCTSEVQSTRVNKYNRKYIKSVTRNSWVPCRDS